MLRFEVDIIKEILLKQTNRILKDFRDMRFRRNQEDREKTFSSLVQIVMSNIASKLLEIKDIEITTGESTSEIYWSINVIDGSENFKSSVPIFCSSVSLVEKGEVTLSVLYMPFYNRCFFVDKGRGLYSDEGTHSVSNSRKISDYSSFSNLNMQNSPNIGSNSWMYSFVASGAVDAFMLDMTNIESKIAELFIKEAGGLFSKVGNVSIGSNQYLHQELRKKTMEHLGIKKEQISFCCGPTQKPHFWSGKIYERGLISTSHRSTKGIMQINEVVELTRKILSIPSDYKILLMNGSATGAIECGFFNFLGHRDIMNVSFDVFGRRWATEISKILAFYQKKAGIQVALNDIRYSDNGVTKGETSEYEDKISHNTHSDLVFVFSGTSNGFVWKKNNLLGNRSGLNICDATSAAFAEELPWNFLDVTCFSFQKALGAEAGLGCVVLSPKAVSQLKEKEFAFMPPRIIRLEEPMLTNVVNGKLINTISMLNLQEIMENLRYIEERGGHEFLVERCLSNQAIIEKNLPDELEFLLSQKRLRCRSLLAIRPKNPELRNWDFLKKVASLCEERGVHSICGLEEEMPCWRFWTGPMNYLVEKGFHIFKESYEKISLELKKKIS